MFPLAASFEVDLVPGGPLRLAVTLFLLLLISYVVVRGTVAVGDKLTPMIWPSLAFFGLAVFAIAYSQVRDDGNDVVRFTVEADSLSVESSQSGASPESLQGGGGGDSFSHAGAVEHDHDDFADHTHP